jgi:hypothetical protein
MAYKCVTNGMDELIQAMEQLGNAGRGAAAGGLFEAAGKYADSVSRAVNGIAVEPFKYAAGGRKRRPSPEERAVLQGAGGAGIAKFKSNGLSVDTSIGYNKSGYAIVGGSLRKNARTNYRYDAETGRVVHASKAKAGSQNVKPVAVIANAINSGTSFMEKQPFFRKAVRQADGAARSAFEAKAVEILDKAANENK